MKRASCFVFDIDDTLYLERDYVRSGFQFVERWLLDHELRAEGFADRAWSEFLGGRRGDTFDVVLNQIGIRTRPGLVEKIVQVYRSHEPDICLRPDALELLSSLSVCAHVAVISDGPLASQSAKAEVLGLYDHTDLLIFTASYGPGYGKPHPRAFREVQERTGVKARECVYVADNPEKDFSGPKELGWQTVRIRRPGGLHEHVAARTDVDLEVVELGGLLDELLMSE